MKPRSSLRVALVVALLPSAAFAQVAASPPVPPPIESVTPLAPVAIGAPMAAALPRRDTTQPRLRVGFAGTVALAIARQPLGFELLSIAPGLALDVGLQISDHAAVYARIELSSVLFMSQAAGYLVGEWSPLDGLSLGTGFGVDGLYTLAVSDGGGAWWGWSVPLVVGLNSCRRQGPSAQRGCFRVGLEAAVGVQPFGPISPRGDFVGWHTTLALGYTLM